MTVTQHVVDGIHRIDTDYPELANCPLFVYIIVGDEPLLVDTACASSVDGILDAALPELGLTPRDLRWLLVTHGHADHCGGCQGLKARTPARLAAPLGDACWIESPDRQWRELWAAYPGTYDAAAIEPAIRAQAGGPTTIDILLRDRDRFEMADRTLEVIATPGHSRGHCAYFEPHSRALFTGDAVHGRIVASCDGVTAFGPVHVDVAASRDTLARLREMPFEWLLPAHSPPVDRDGGLRLLDESLAMVDELRELTQGLVARGVTTRHLARAIGERIGAMPPITPQSVMTADALLRDAAARGLAEPAATPVMIR